jgi:LysM domain
VRSIVQAYVLEREEEMAMTTMTVTPQLRLTRRGRLLLTLFGALLASVLFGVGHLPSTQASDRPSTLPPTTTVVVQPGQTLWEIAVRLAPDQDPRGVVSTIEELNGMTTASVRAGQSLLVPA